jgi:16S rRNA (uracil1498-N3)-methyltransferase
LQGISSGERMDYTVQKAVELGVAEIWPLLAERSVVRLDRERAEKRRLHWQRVAIAACEQSGRSRVPPVHAPLRLADWLATWRAQRQGNERALLLSPAGGARLAALGEPQGPVILLAGPEGGFTEAEAAAARHQGFLPVRLGPRILRTETAALAALAAIQALWGDF